MRIDYMRGQLPSRRWALWRWQILHRADTGQRTLRRLTLLRCPWFSVMVHWIYCEETPGIYHCHPWSFLSIILRGSYWEMRSDGLHERRRWNRIRPGEFHRVHRVSGPVVSLVLAGPWRHAVALRHE